MAYIFDTNIFIRSKNEMPFDLWPTFWTRVAQMIAEGKVFSHRQVKDEIEKGNDELADWMKANVTADFYIDNDAEVMQKYSDVQNWAFNSKVYRQEAKNEFARVADAFLVATASAKGYTLVTYETSNPDCKKRVKIPEACAALGVKYCGLNAVLRDLGITI